GYAKAIIEIATERVRVAPAPGAAPNSPAAGASPDSAAPGAAPGGSPADSTAEAAAAPRSLYRAEVTLLDLGTGAVPEVTQEPEPPPIPPTSDEHESPVPGKLIK
ncbi:MAG: hypothetical protein HY568_01170, partial [Candidatus Latescibacteria bacterium]|nr:hypothetical protein [Candidatus Latescibacterota bacterium]